MAEKSKKTGFTLIELLVVLFIICLVTIVVLINTNQPDTSRTQATFAQLLKAQMQVAREQAILQTSVLALGFNNNSYQFFLYTEKTEGYTFTPLQVSDPFWKLYKIPPLILISLQKNHLRELRSNINFEDTSSLILFFPSGEISPFRLTLHGKNTKLTTEVIGTQNGSVEILRKENE